MSIEGIRYFQRVASTARLVGAKGSVQDRRQFAHKLNQKLYLMDSEIIKKRVESGGKAFITAQEFYDNFKKLTGKVGIKLEKNDSAMYCGYMTPAVNPETGQLAGIYLALPFEKNNNTWILKQDYNTRTKMHESWHALEFLALPKYSARFHKVETLKREETSFYKKFLYTKNQKNIDFIKNEMSKHLENPYLNFSLLERINIMQNWRYMLQSESSAYKEGNFYDRQELFKNTKEKIKKLPETYIGLGFFGNDFNTFDLKTTKEKQLGLAKFKKEINVIENKKVNNEYLFEEKIKVLEEMILATITKARKNMAIKREKETIRKFRKQASLKKQKAVM